MSTITSLFANIEGAKLVNANGTSASSFKNSAPFNPATYQPTKHIVTPLPDVVPLADPASKQVTVFAIFNEPATETIHETTDIHAHNLMKLRLRTNGHMFHTSHASGLLKLQARRWNEKVRKMIKLAKEKE